MEQSKTYLATVATTTGLGPFHPAIRSMISGWILYWPNITFETEDAAHEYAVAHMQQAENAAEAIAQTWNLEEYP